MPVTNNENHDSFLEAPKSVQSVNANKKSNASGKTVKFVIISGMRTRTLLQRIPFLPSADAYCCEGGGQIFYQIPVGKPKNCETTSIIDDSGEEADVENKTMGTALPEIYESRNEEGAVQGHFRLQEDMEWRKIMGHVSAAGPDGYDGIVDIQKRDGLLWSFARKLVKMGWVIDYSGYGTCFRVHRGKQLHKAKQSKEIFDVELPNLKPAGLACSTNLGCVDFYPDRSGKKNCCEFVAAKFGAESLSESCVCLCDDDNDLEMAGACRRAFIPSVASESMSDAINKSPDRLILTCNTNITETDATDAALRMVLDLCTLSST